MSALIDEKMTHVENFSFVAWWENEHAKASICFLDHEKCIEIFLRPDQFLELFKQMKDEIEGL